jgi:hypothetical protein
VRTINHDRIKGANTPGQVRIVEEGLDKSDLLRVA